MSEPTLEEILVLYQKAATGVNGTCDKFPSVTKEVADKIRNVVGNTSITLTGQQLLTACGFAGIHVDPAALEGNEEILETEFTFESKTNICREEDDFVYVGLSLHITESPEEGYQPLEPGKWEHRSGEHGSYPIMVVC